MKSPFPGMDPYLESHWGDVHGSLAFFAKLTLQPQLQGNVVARNDRRFFLDDGKFQWRGETVQGVSAGEISEPFVQIVEYGNSERVLTVIEFISPASKLSASARGSYRRQMEHCLQLSRNLVEVDLTRVGDRELLISESDRSTAAERGAAVNRR
jgi:hypothetical protein